MYTQKTFVLKPVEAEKKWYLVDAEGKTVGRLATQIADILRGKNNPKYTPHTDSGDFVVVVNAEKVVFTGNKLDEKVYYRHSGYVGGLKERTAKEQLQRQPTKVLRFVIFIFANEPVSADSVIIAPALFSNDDVYSVAENGCTNPSELVYGESTNTSVSLRTSLTVGK